jgi:TRAP-type C4-dicarboxylate transport system permease small subunit
MALLIKTIEWVVIALMGLISAVVTAEVFLRDTFGVSIGVHEELTRYLMIWVAMLGSVLLTYDGSHIRVALISDLLSGKAKTAMLLTVDLVVIFFLSVFVYGCVINLPGTLRQDTVTLGVGMVWFHAALPVGGALMLLVAAMNLLRTIAVARAGVTRESI